MNIQNKADRLLDKVIDSQEQKTQQHQDREQDAAPATVEHDTVETKVHPMHSAAAEETQTFPETEHTVAHENVAENHHEETHIPPQPRTQPRSAPVLKENPHQNFIYAATSAVAAVLSLFLIPLTLLITPATILFGMSALLYSRKSERDGWNTWVPKFLGWATLLTGVAALFFGLFVMFILYIVKMT